MGLLSDLNTVQWVMIGVPLAAAWVLLICGTHSNGKRSPWAGLVLGPLFIPLLVVLAPFGLVALVVDGVKRRKPVQVVVGVVLSLMLAGYVAAVVALGGPPPPTPADLPVER
jgi:hypothetical protein